MIYTADDVKENRQSAGTIRKRHTLALQRRLDYITQTATETTEAARRRLDDEREALRWAIDLAGRFRWRRIADEQPTAGATVSVVSTVAGITTAVVTPHGLLCSCGCGEMVPAVALWSPLPEVPGDVSRHLR